MTNACAVLQTVEQILSLWIMLAVWPRALRLPCSSSGSHKTAYRSAISPTRSLRFAQQTSIQMNITSSAALELL